ncbi:hypothetical protein FMEAI12_3090015 [Parafrankia sp. Ea1.12]|nr:hypothetical protein FMEAI12_3090015 [Parafrankia sp. Ea1.12]
MALEHGTRPGGRARHEAGRRPAGAGRARNHGAKAVGTRSMQPESRRPAMCGGSVSPGSHSIATVARHRA